MDNGPHPYEHLDDPAPDEAPAAPKQRRVPRVAVAAGLTVFLALAGAGLAFATSGGGGSATPLSSSGSSSTTSVPGKHGRPAMRAGGFAGRGFGAFGGLGGFGGGGSIVHAQYTEKDGSGYRTMDYQSGQVTSVSSSSITVKSSDGYTATYAVQPTTVVDSQSGGISAVDTNDAVVVTAVVDNSTATATNLVDTTKVGASRQSFGFGPANGSKMRGTPPTTTAAGPSA